MGTMVLLDLMGGVALLLWGLHMVQSGILRAFGSDLRHLLSKALRNRFAAFAAGLGADRAAAEQHGDGADDRLVHGAGRGRAWRRRLRSCSAPTSARRSSCSSSRSTSRRSHRSCSSPASSPSAAAPRSRDQGPGSCLHRPRAGAAGAAHPARHARTGRERAERAGAARRHHRRSANVHPARGAPHLGGPFERRDRAADHVAGLLEHSSLRRPPWPWCSAPTSAAPSIRVFEGGHRGDAASYRLPVGNLDQPAGRRGARRRRSCTRSRMRCAPFSPTWRR